MHQLYRFRRLFFRIFLVFLGGNLFLFYLFYYLPEIVNRQIVPAIVHYLPVEVFDCKVRRIGLFRSDVSNVRVGSKNTNTIEIDAIHLDYRPLNLISGHLNQLTIIGLKCHAIFENGRFRFPGIRFDHLAPVTWSSGQPEDSGGLLPGYDVHQIRVQNGSLTLAIEEVLVQIPFEITVLSEKKDHPAFAGKLILFPETHSIKLGFNLNLKNMLLSLSLDSNPVTFGDNNILNRMLSGLHLSGTVRLSGHTDLTLRPFQIRNSFLSCTFKNVGTRYQSIMLAPSNVNHGEPMQLTVRSDDGKSWAAAVNVFSLSEPVPVKIFDGGLEIQSRKNGFFLKSTLKLETAEFSEKMILGYVPLSLKQSVVFDVRIDLFYSHDKTWKLNCRVEPLQPDQSLEFTRKDLNGVVMPPSISINGVGKADVAHLDFEIQGRSMNISYPPLNIRLPSCKIGGKVNLDKTSDPPAGKIIDFEFKATDGKIELEEGDFRIPEIYLSGKLSMLPRKPVQFSGLLKISEAEFENTDLKISVRGIGCLVPFKWPLEDTRSNGGFTLKSIRLQDISVGDVKGIVWQEAGKIVFRGSHDSEILKGIQLNFNGEASLDPKSPSILKLNCFLSQLNPFFTLDMGKYIPSLKGFVMTGKANLKGNFIFGKQRIERTLDIHLQQGIIHGREKDLYVDNIRLDLSFSDPHTIRSGAGQKLSVTRASWGKIDVRDVNIDFHVESPRSLFIEQCRFKWSQGTVSTYSIRIPGESDAYRLRLYCDRLNFSQVLEQLGAGKAEGDGTVNGTIPIHIENGEISFHDGFLFSTPGDEGTIHFWGTDMIHASVEGVGTPVTQIDLVKEALKDYQYKWAKLKLLTEGKNLLVHLKMDGKPLKPLPFVYSQSVGGFVRVKEDERGSVFQGIGLDVNMRLPLNRILKYKDLIQTISGQKG